MKTPVNTNVRPRKKGERLYRVVLDMDGTLANFNAEKNAVLNFATLNGFFLRLKPNKLTFVINEMIDKKQINPNRIYIVSASPHEQADKDKMEWLKNNCPQIPKKNVLFTRIGENKADRFKDTFKIKDFRKYILVDDFTLNLKEWFNSGGEVMKYLNGYNNTTKKYLSLGISPLDLTTSNSLLNYKLSY